MAHAPDETPLAMATRHGAEGRERIAHQEALIADLTREGHTKMLAEAYRLLESITRPRPDRLATTGQKSALVG